MSATRRVTTRPQGGEVGSGQVLGERELLRGERPRDRRHRDVQLQVRRDHDPGLNQAPNGGIAILSPANTAVCLTTTAGSCSATEPDQLLPVGGKRNYARVVWPDPFQGAA